MKIKNNIIYKKFLISVFLFSCFCVFMFPQNIFAQCNSSGITVVYINGIFTPIKKAADADRDKLMIEYQKHFNISDITFRTGYNPSRIAGLGDLIQTASQILNHPISDFDFKTILNQIHSEIKTKKVILVGYSQGTFYANEMYNYLIKNGISKESLAVYNVATPANYVAGNGNYATSKEDEIINSIREIAKKINVPQPLPGNIDTFLNEQEKKDSSGGHSFSQSYLKKAPKDIVSGVNNGLNKLENSPESTDVKNGCFNLPDQNFEYQVQKFTYPVTDFIGNGVVKTGVVAYNGVVFTGETTAKIVIGTWETLADSSVELSKSMVDAAILAEKASIATMDFTTKVATNTVIATTKIMDQVTENTIQTIKTGVVVAKDTIQTTKNIVVATTNFSNKTVEKMADDILAEQKSVIKETKKINAEVEPREKPQILMLAQSKIPMTIISAKPITKKEQPKISVATEIAKLPKTFLNQKPKEKSTIKAPLIKGVGGFSKERNPLNLPYQGDLKKKVEIITSKLISEPTIMISEIPKNLFPEIINQKNKETIKQKNKEIQNQYLEVQPLNAEVEPRETQEKNAINQENLETKKAEVEPRENLLDLIKSTPVLAKEPIPISTPILASNPGSITYYSAPAPTTVSTPAPTTTTTSSSTSSSAPTSDSLPTVTVPIVPDPTLPPILISEVCPWLEKLKTTYIELYNPNDFEITLNNDNFHLKFIDSENEIIEKSVEWIKNKIPAKGYFLLSMTPTIENLSADAIFTEQMDLKGVIISDGQNNIKDKMEKIILQNNQSLERKIEAIDFSLANVLSPTNSLNEKNLYDFQAPETILEKSPDKETTSNLANFVFSSNESEVIFQYSFDNSEWENGVATKEFQNLKLGWHTLKVRTIDLSGNIDRSPIIFQWQIELPKPTYLDGEMTKDTILSAENNPYIIENSFIVPEGKTLTIGPGVIIWPKNANLFVSTRNILFQFWIPDGVNLIAKGTLIINGTKENPVKFTSLYKNPIPGDYGQALLIKQTSKNSVLENVIFEYGDAIMITVIPMVEIQGADVKMSNVVFRKSRDEALRLVNSNSVIDNCIFEDNIATALLVEGGQPKIKNSQFKNNYTGISISNQSKVIMENNIFTNNQEPLKMDLSGNEINFDESNQVFNNALNGFKIYSGYFPSSNTVILSKISNNLPYIILSNRLVINSKTLIINPGVVIKSKIDNNYPLIDVRNNGNLIINGIENEPVIITSLKDDTVGGDTNNDGSASLPAKNDWTNIVINSGGNAELNNLKLKYGSDKPLIINNPANVLQNNVSVE